MPPQQQYQCQNCGRFKVKTVEESRGLLGRLGTILFWVGVVWIVLGLIGAATDLQRPGEAAAVLFSAVMLGGTAVWFGRKTRPRAALLECQYCGFQGGIKLFNASEISR